MKTLPQSLIPSWERGRFARLWLVFLGACFLFSVAAGAQQETATLTGVILDPAGLVVPEANVSATNTATGIVSRTVTNGAGVYTIINLKVGAYTLGVDKAGFHTYLQDGLTLEVNQVARIDVTLQLGAQSEVIRVTAEAPLLETETASRGAVIDQDKMADLPLNGRDYNQLALLSPGVLQATPRFSISDLQFKGAFNANGNRVFMNAFLLDGLDNVSYSNSYRGENVQVVQPSVDALVEFKIQTANYSAEWGRNAGAVVNAAIRSGANNFHGTLYEFFRNDALDANNFFANFLGQRKPELRRNQFGGSLGGPIARKKTFFFTDYEGLRDRDGVPRFLSLPTAAMKAGNFAGVASVFDPTVIGRPAFLNNVIPAGKFDPVGQKLLAFLPDPTGPGLSNNYFRTVVNSTRTDQFDIRVDHQWSEPWNFFARYSFVDSTIVRPSPMPGLAEGSFIDTFGTTRNRSQSLAAGGTWNINPRRVADLRGSYARGSYHVEPPNAGSPCPADLLGIVTPPIDKQFCGGLPKIVPSGFSAFGRHTSTPQFQEPETLDGRFSLSQVKGAHLIKSGAELLYVRVSILDIGQLIGNFSFDGSYTGNPIADILMGMPRTFALNNGVIFENSQRLMFAYVQDDWKIFPKLTMNLGLRYETATPPREAEDRFSNFDPALGRFVFAGQDDGGLGRSLVRQDNNNFAPRFGFAWQPLSHTALRGGYGIFYNHTNRQGREGLLDFNPPFLVEPTINGTSTVPAFILRNGYPPGILDPQRVTDPLVSTTTFRRAVQIDLRTPYIQQWSLGIQREVMNDLLVEVAYVGNKGARLPGFRNLNYGNPAPLTGPTVQLQDRRLLPQHGDIQYMESRVNTNYHSLQLRVEKRHFHGFSTQASYTLGKALGDSVDHLSTSAAGTPGFDIGANRSPQDPRNLGAEYGPSEFDVKQRLVWSYLWQVPFGKGQRWLKVLPKWQEFLAGGWQINGINILQSGLPLTLGLGTPLQTNFDMGGERSRRPDVTGPLVPSGFQQTVDRWFDTGKLAVPSSPFGNSGVGNLRGPNLVNVDLSLFKNYKLSEIKRFQFRLEMFNTFNHTNLGLPLLTYSGTPAGGGFGTIRATNTPARVLQFGLKLYF